jgi:AAA15 family ATPase/GTPase
LRIFAFSNQKIKSIMTENEMILLHDRLYGYLKKRHEEDPTFGFDTQNEAKSKGYWFHLGHLFLVLNGRAKNIPCFRIHYQYGSSNWLCSIDDIQGQNLIYKIKSNEFKLEQPVELLNNLLLALGFSKKGYWMKTFLIGDDFLQSFDSFMKNEFNEIRAFFKKKLHLSETEKDKTTSEYIDTIEKQKQFGHVKERYRLLYNPSIPHLPFALSRLEIIDFQGIKHLVIDNIPADTQWIFLTGNNGYGKTSLLRAIAKGLVGDEDLVESLPEKTQIYVNGYNWNEPFSVMTQHKQLIAGDFQVATYGASRFRYNNEPIKNKKKTYPLFSDDAPLIYLEDILIKAERAKSEKREKNGIIRFDKLKQFFLKVIPQLVDIKVEYFEDELLTDNYQVRYYEKGENGDVYEAMPFSDLAAGYRSILSIIGDMIVRLSAHPKNSLDDLQGIVLIDEIDAHLHPKYQYELPKLLSEVFPKVQFIVSTHSPMPLLGVPKDVKSVVWTVHRTAADGITVERLDDDIEIGRLSANALLTSDIFNFKNIFARGATPDTIESFNDYDRIKAKNKSDKLLELKQGIKDLNIKL